MCVVGAIAAADAKAQNPPARSGERGGMERREGGMQQGRNGRPQRMTPEQQARMATDRMTKELGLNETQVKKVYKINHTYYTDMRNLIMGSAGAGMGGMRGQGMGPGGNFGGHGGDMGGFGDGAPGMQGQRGPGRGMMPRISQEDMDKLNATRDKKFSKVLTSDQMSRWRKSEAERRQKQLDRMKQMRENRQGQPGSRSEGQRHHEGQRRQAE